MHVIRVEQLTKFYGTRKVLSEVSFSVEQGEIFALLGPNGAGKTTIIKILAALTAPTYGRAEVNGYDVIKEPQRVRESIGIVFQEPSTDELLTAEENLRFHCMLYGIESEREKKIKKALEFIELYERRNDLVKTFSGGMRRRLEIARATLHDPAVIFLDEPTIGLDPNARRKMWAYIKRLAKEHNMTVMLTTHYMEEAQSLCDRVAIINKGKIIEMGTTEELLGQDRIMIEFEDVAHAKEFSKKLTAKHEIKSQSIIINIKDYTKELPKLFYVSNARRIEVKRASLEDLFTELTEDTGEEPESSWFDKVVEQKSRKE